MKKIISLIISFIIINLSFSLIAAENSSNNDADNNIITVDDEPGDADFTSIKEAVNYSSPGDIIKVYSGTYPDDKIFIVKENISLLGMSYELGVGNDSGKPFIIGNGSEAGTSIHIEASYVIVSNFHIKRGEIFLGTHNLSNFLRNITISDCIIHNKNGKGIGINYVSKSNLVRNINITNNEISHCQYGIQVFSSVNLNIKGNVITDIKYSGIYFADGGENISYNIFKRCDIGIIILIGSNIIYSNDFEDCSLGISIPSWRGISIIKNNFKNYSYFKSWFKVSFLDLFRTKDRWIGNYWNTWNGIGPKRIRGTLIFNFYYMSFPIPWFAFDWQPAKEPYDIHYVS